MGFSIHRRWLWLFGTLALLGLLLYGVARSLDEPVRRYMETEANRRLTGYTVRIPGLRVHLWNASVEVRDASLVQDENPDPPVIHMERFVTAVDWRALLHRRIVADLTFERPTAFLNLRQVRTEAASDVPLKERGWQHVLEALALDLKINRLRIINGDVTYVDQGPFKPLHVSHLNLNAENIRNIASQEQVYPSPIHLEAVVFDAGSVWLDGRADFLAEPHVGVQAALRLDQVALDRLRLVFKIRRRKRMVRVGWHRAKQARGRKQHKHRTFHTLSSCELNSDTARIRRDISAFRNPIHLKTF
jgi:hypothetical protein